MAQHATGNDIQYTQLSLNVQPFLAEAKLDIWEPRSKAILAQPLGHQEARKSTAAEQQAHQFKNHEKPASESSLHRVFDPHLLLSNSDLLPAFLPSVKSREK